MAAPDPILLRNEETLWTVKEVCEYLQACRAWVYKRAEDGTLGLGLPMSLTELRRA